MNSGRVFSTSLRAASARYDAEAILLIRLHEFQPTLSEARWSLLMDGGEQHWTTRSDLPELLLEDGVHVAADFLAARYARPAEEDATGMVDMVVTGVRTLHDYARALEYLDSLEEVERVDVDAVEPDQVRFRVAVHGGTARDPGDGHAGIHSVAGRLPRPGRHPPTAPAALAG